MFDSSKSKQVYPVNMMAPQYATQQIPFDTSALKAITCSLPADEKTLTIGYDSNSTDNPLVANLISAQLGAAGFAVKVRSYPTSQIYGWVGNPDGAPDILATLGWPDAPLPYTWAHNSFDPDGGWPDFRWVRRLVSHQTYSRVRVRARVGGERARAGGPRVVNKG